MSVDQKVYDLACVFLACTVSAEVNGATEESKQALAEAIQQTIEDFIAEKSTTAEERTAELEAWRKFKQTVDHDDLTTMPRLSK